mmetsp:Transcript_21975/g.63351  ORF Transcript_21975/g.63351 Transcript_21975/m.63351 type:complete len:373 (+) Transcript_21975:1040-2158(+)
MPRQLGEHKVPAGWILPELRDPGEHQLVGARGHRVHVEPDLLAVPSRRAGTRFSSKPHRPVERHLPVSDEAPAMLCRRARIGRLHAHGPLAAQPDPHKQWGLCGGLAPHLQVLLHVHPKACLGPVLRAALHPARNVHAARKEVLVDLEQTTLHEGVVCDAVVPGRGGQVAKHPPGGHASGYDCGQHVLPGLPEVRPVSRGVAGAQDIAGLRPLGAEARISRGAELPGLHCQGGRLDVALKLRREVGEDRGNGPLEPPNQRQVHCTAPGPMRKRVDVEAHLSVHALHQFQAQLPDARGEPAHACAQLAAGNVLTHFAQEDDAQLVRALLEGVAVALPGAAAQLLRAGPAALLLRAAEPLAEDPRQRQELEAES